MSSEDECDFSSGVNSPKSIEFVEDDLNIDIEILISEVQARSLLWDKSLNNYSDRYLKRAAWKEIFILLYPDYEKVSSQHQKLIGNNIEKKWRNVRDAFIRSLKEDKPKSGNGAKKKYKKTYLYHDELRFLIKTITPRLTSSSINLNNTAYDNVENDTINDNDISNNTINEYTNIEHNLQTSEIVTEQCSTLNNSGLNKQKQSKQKESNVEKKFLEYLEVQTQKGINDDKQDQHQEFFNSLLPIVRKFNDDQTLLFRSEVIKIAQTIKRGQSSSLPESIKPNVSSTSFQHQPYFHQPPYSPYRMYNPNNQQYIHPQQTSSQHANTQYNILHTIPTRNTSLYVQSQNVQNVHSLRPPVQTYASSQLNVVSPESPHQSNASSPSPYSTSTLSHHSDIVPGRDEIYSDSDIMDEFLTTK